MINFRHVQVCICKRFLVISNLQLNISTLTHGLVYRKINIAISTATVFESNNQKLTLRPNNKGWTSVGRLYHQKDAK